jgi:predicted secreted protein
MSWFSILAIYFVLWWLTLFAVLPFGLRTQEEDGAVAPGTHESAPRGPHMMRAVVFTTIVSALLFSIYYVVTVTLGLGVNDLPRFMPDFGTR